MAYTILGEIHIGREDIRPGSVLSMKLMREQRSWSRVTNHRFSKEVLLQRPFPCHIVLQCDVSVCAESTRKHRDVPEDRFADTGVSS